MKPTILVLAVCLTSTTVCNAEILSNDRIQIRPVIGYANFDNSHFLGDTGDNPIRLKKEDFVLGVAASLNHRWGNWRGELEYAWRYRTDLNGYVYYDDRDLGIRSNVENQTLSLNLYRYFEPGNRFRTYLTAGAGVALNRSDAQYSDNLNPTAIETGSHSETHLSWNVGFGAVFDLTDRWSLDLGYRQVFLGQATTPRFSDDLAVSSGDISSHDIALTLSRRFGQQKR